MSDSHFDGKVAVVTGGSTGIGAATVRLFAERGTRVIIGDVNDEAGKELAETLVSEGHDVTYVHTDVSQESDASGLIQAAVDRFGTLDYAFNCAGIEGEAGATADASLAVWNRTIGINLTGVFLAQRAELRQMLKQGHGSIVNMSSAVGLVGQEMFPAYVASKHGIIGLTKAAALDHAAQGIRVNAVAPGVIDAPMNHRFAETAPDEVVEAVNTSAPMRRPGSPSEVGEAVLWLCSPAASYVTGHTVAVDGGYIIQ